jgi:hypothetical protein
VLKGIAAVRKRAYEREEILRFLTTKEIPARLRYERQLFVRKRVLVSPQVGTCWGKQGNVAGNENVDAPVTAADADITDKKRTQLCDRLASSSRMASTLLSASTVMVTLATHGSPCSASPSVDSRAIYPAACLASRSLKQRLTWLRIIAGPEV